MHMTWPNSKNLEFGCVWDLWLVLSRSWIKKQANWLGPSSFPIWQCTQSLKVCTRCNIGTEYGEMFVNISLFLFLFCAGSLARTMTRQALSTHAFLGSLKECVPRQALWIHACPGNPSQHLHLWALSMHVCPSKPSGCMPLIASAFTLAWVIPLNTCIPGPSWCTRALASPLDTCPRRPMHLHLPG